MICVLSIVMNVSLWGPHSFETFTLEPTVADPVVPTAPVSVPAWMNWYFCHQVGSFELLLARAGTAATNPISETRRTRMLTPPESGGGCARRHGRQRETR